MRRKPWPQLVVVLGGLLVVAASCAPEPVRQPVIVPTVAPTTSVAPTATSAPTLPANCAQLIQGNQLDAAIGTPVSATLNLVIGEAVPGIGRLGRTTCRYGTPVGGVYPVEISLSSYTNAGQAKARVTAAVTDAEQQGIGSSTVPAGGVDGSYIPLPAGGLVVAAAGGYAVAVSVAKTLIPADKVAAKLGSVAGIVLASVGV